MTRRIPLTLPSITERARHLLSGALTPAVPRDAATVILLREGAGGPEVFLLRRSAGMAFAPGAHVFPGGAVDPSDSDPAVPWSGPAPGEFGTALGVPADRARALVCAAVRETFEECGVLLRADLLTPWARWITPEIEPRRYDTFFFVAALPDGQAADGWARDGESDAGGWFTPGAALAAARDGSALLLPPTAVCLGQLAAAGEVPAIVGQRRPVSPLCPEVVEADGRMWLTIPDEVEYPL